MLSEINQFVNWVRRRSPSARTWKDYGFDLHFFAQVSGDVPLKEVSFHQVDAFICQQSEQGFKPTTINRRLAAIIALYAFYADEDDELLCPVIPKRHHMREPRRLPRPVQEADLRKFFAVIKSARDLAMFTLMLRCGLRISEVASLQLVDLFLEEDYPRLLVRGKGARERSVYLSPQARRVLQNYLLERPLAADDHVFLSYQGKGMSTTAIHLRLKRYREKAGLELTAHQLRHSFANDLLNAEVPITTIQKLMGHRWIESTQTYVVANDRQVREDYYAASQRLEGWSYAQAHC